MKIWLVVKKELLEILRDRMTFVIMIIPILIYPLLKSGITYLSKSPSSDIQIAIFSDDKQTERFFDNFLHDKNYKVKIIQTNDPEQMLKTGKLDCLIAIEDKKFSFTYQSASYHSLSLATKLCEDIKAYYADSLKQTGINPYEFTLRNEQGQQDSPESSVFSVIIPILFILFAVQGSSGFANNTFAGEKERGTLELLLLSCEKKHQIYFGKLLPIIFLSVIENIISIGVCCATFKDSIFLFNTNEGNRFAFFCMLLLLIFLSVLASTWQVFISIMSNNMKNAQLLNEMTVFIPAGLAGVFSFGLLSMQNYFDYIPVIGLVSTFLRLFKGEFHAASFLIAMLTNALFLIFIIWMSIKRIKSEKILYHL